MPEDKEKIEDFISLWRKKMENERDKPSVIGETLDKIKEVEKENELLRNKIKDNIELISKTEKVIKSTIEENQMLKTQLRQAGISIVSNGSELQKKNVDFNNKILDLEKKLAEKEVELRARYNEKIELETKLEAALKSKVGAPSINSGQDIILIDDIKTELAKRKNQIDELVNKVSELTEQNEVLNQQLVEKMEAVIRPQSNQASTETLERLCQDLQQDLNKYKRNIEKLNKEKHELQEALISGGYKLEPEEIKVETSSSLRLNEKINHLQEQIKERDNLIIELKAHQQNKIIASKEPISNLVEDLQNKINKLKITIEEKNKIIEELKSS